MIIYVDLDGTLLNDKSEITDYTRKIIAQLQEKGHLFVFNTARSLTATKEFLKYVTPDYLILNGGNQIFDKNLNILFESRIPLDKTKEIIECLHKNNVNHILVELGDGFVSDSLEYVKKHLYTHYLDFKEIDKGALKIVYETSEDFNDQLLLQIYDLDMTNYVGGKLHKISVHDKSFGNTKLEQLLSNTDKTISFGDDLGDILMIKNSDVKVCMKNSQPELFKYNFSVTDYTNDEDGVAKYLEKLLLS